MIFNFCIELSCIGITYEPINQMWSLKTSSMTDSGTTDGYISYLKDCVEFKITIGSGKFDMKLN